jgi:hypothetical protein|tara:strand:- start:4690 stop:4905 length:216 start_codon:yes stop_codon:yes gene_type:complete
MIRNIRHIQIKKVAYHPNLFKAILTYEKHPTEWDESDDLEYQKNNPQTNFLEPEVRFCDKTMNKVGRDTGE